MPTSHEEKPQTSAEKPTQKMDQVEDLARDLINPREMVERRRLVTTEA